MPLLFSLTSDALPDGTLVIAFSGHEGLSQLYRFEIDIAVPLEGAALDVDAALFAPATLAVHREDGEVRAQWHGVLSSLELLRASDDSGRYRVVLGPSLFRLGLSRHSRVFVDKSAPDVIEATLKAAGLASDDYALRMQRSKFTPHEHVCQYRESDLDFVSRWMEREGLYYFFDHEGDKELLVITDGSADHAVRGDLPVRFLPGAGFDGGAAEALGRFTVRVQATPHTIKAVDHDPLRPSVELKAPSDVGDAGRGDVVRWQAGFTREATGKRFASAGSGRLVAAQKRFTGEGRAFDLRPGYLFDLDEHPLAAFNTRYLTVDLEHEADQADLVGQRDERDALIDRVYSVRVEAIDASTRFVPPLTTAWPHVRGTEIAAIDGAEDSDYAQLDDHGRYRVRIRFDEGTEKPDGQASTWIRMMQPHGGNPEGHHFPLRKKTEVLLVFLGGDPDRPVIAGAAPDLDSPSVITKANHTQNIIHTGGNNHFEIEDDDGKQYIDISSPTEKSFLHLGAHHGSGTHNTVLSTSGNGLIHTGGQYDTTVGGQRHETVKKAVKETFHSTQRTEVVGNVLEQYNATQTVTVTNNCDEYYGSHSTTVDIAKIEKCAEQETTVGGALSEQHGLQATMVSGNTHVTAGSLSLTASAAAAWTFGGTFNVTTTGGTTITSPAGMIVNAPNIEFRFPNRSETTTTHFEFHWTNDEHFKSVDDSLDGVRISINGVTEAAAAVKLESGGLSLGISGRKFEIGATKLDIFGFKFGGAVNDSKASSVILSLFGLTVKT